MNLILDPHTTTTSAITSDWDSASAREFLEGGSLSWSEIGGLRQLARRDRKAALRELNNVFRSGKPSVTLDGPADLRLVATGIAGPIDRMVAIIDDRVRPWVAKVFDTNADVGENWLSVRPRFLTRIALFPARLPVEDEVLRGLPFDTYVGPSQMYPELEVLHIDYSRHRRNPYLMRKITRDEVVEVGDGVHLGLVHARGLSGKRVVVGYFALRARRRPLG